MTGSLISAPKLYSHKQIPWFFGSFHQAYRSFPPESQHLCQRYRAKCLPPLQDQYTLLKCRVSFSVKMKNLRHELFFTICCYEMSLQFGFNCMRQLLTLTSKVKIVAKPCTFSSGFLIISNFQVLIFCPQEVVQCKI